jgi:hypothetical protein
MVDIKLVTVSSLVIVFLSVFSIHYAFNGIVNMAEFCSVKTGDICQPANLFIFFLFSFLFIVSFVAVIETTLYYMFKGIDLLTKRDAAQEKRIEETITSLEKKVIELEKSKKGLQKKYFNRQVDQDSYSKLKHKYDSELMETEMRISELKKKKDGA